MPLSTPFIYAFPKLRVFSEDANLITALQDELKNLKDEMVQLNKAVSAVCVGGGGVYF